MKRLKSNTKSEDSLKQPNRGRRSFLWKIGAGMSAVLAATVPAIAKPVISRDKTRNNNIDYFVCFLYCHSYQFLSVRFIIMQEIILPGRRI